MYSPFSENMTIIVKSKATKVTGLIFGMNFRSYQSFPFNLIRLNLLIIPARNGMPRKMKTLFAICTMVISTLNVFSPCQEGNTVRKIQA
jgi:hypothetical protein